VSEFLQHERRPRARADARTAAARATFRFVLDDEAGIAHGAQKNCYGDFAPGEKTVPLPDSRFASPQEEDDLMLAQTLRAVRAIRGGTIPPDALPGVARRLKLAEDIHAALEHVCSAIDAVVEWMEQDARPDADALRLINRLRGAGDMLARCAGEHPLKMIADREELSP
jgi:hypothetical protein